MNHSFSLKQASLCGVGQLFLKKTLFPLSFFCFIKQNEHVFLLSYNITTEKLLSAIFTCDISYLNSPLKCKKLKLKYLRIK